MRFFGLKADRVPVTSCKVFEFHSRKRFPQP